jgi:hypothetical protein
MDGKAMLFDLPEPVSPDRHPIPMRFFPGGGVSNPGPDTLEQWRQNVAEWEAVPKGARVRFSAQWNGSFAYDLHTHKHWTPYIVLYDVKLLAQQ